MTKNHSTTARRGKPADRKLRSAAHLTLKQTRFVAEYLIDLNATQAAIRAGYSAKTAEQQGPRLLGNAGVHREIEIGRSRLANKLEVSAERVLAEAWHILTADTRELVEHHVGCCRYCWGHAFRYQRTAAEMGRDFPSGGACDEQGGIGFDPRRDPNPSCPECFGKGQGRTYINDTRKLSASAAALYAGIKQTKDGIEVRLHSKVDALERLFRYLGLHDRLRLGAETAAHLKADSGLALADRGRAVLAAAAAGEVSVTHAGQLLAGLGVITKLVETDELAARVAALEKRHEDAAKSR